MISSAKKSPRRGNRGRAPGRGGVARRRRAWYNGEKTPPGKGGCFRKGIVFMNKVIETFGKTVGGMVESAPRRALALLRAAYGASGLQMRYFPDKRLLPHQRYIAVMNNRAVRLPLNRPDRSAVVNVFLPCELLHAMNILPQFTEGLACYLNGAGSERAFIGYAENAGIPQTYCSYHKTLLGAALSGVMPKPRFVANTTLACDANMGTFRAVAEHYGVPHFVLDVPAVRTEEAERYVTGQLREFTAFLEKVMGERMNPDRLRAVIRRENRSLALYRAYFDELAGKYLPNELTSEMYKVFPTHVLLGTPEAERFFRLQLEDTRRAAPSAGEKRILWAHTIPFWQDSIRELLNFSPRYQLLACDMNFDWTAEALDEERPYESMARKLLSHMMNGPEELRAERLLEMAKKLRADGVVYFCHWGCKQTLGGAALTKERLEAAGYPVLILDGDGCDRNNVNDGQMSTRVQAFLEMLEQS